MERLFEGLDEPGRQGTTKDSRMGNVENLEFSNEEGRPSAVNVDAPFGGSGDPPVASGPSRAPGGNIGAGREWVSEPPPRPEYPATSRHGSVALWCAVVALALALAAELGYTYYVFRADHISLAEIPGQLKSIANLGERLGAAEANLRSLTGNWDSLAARLTGLDHKVESRLRAAGRQTQDLVAQSEGRLRAEIVHREQVVDARFYQVESAQKHDQAQLAEANDRLQKEVANLRAEVAKNQGATLNSMASLHQQAGQTEQALNTLNEKLRRQRVNFEVVKDSPAELAPGVSLTILKTDPAYQRFQGYVALTNEGRTLWLQQQHANEGLDLFPNASTHPYSLVITSVNAHGVVGYLLLPAGA